MNEATSARYKRMMTGRKPAHSGQDFWNGLAAILAIIGLLVLVGAIGYAFAETWGKW